MVFWCQIILFGEQERVGFVNEIAPSFGWFIFRGKLEDVGDDDREDADEEEQEELFSAWIYIPRNYSLSHQTT